MCSTELVYGVYVGLFSSFFLICPPLTHRFWPSRVPVYRILGHLVLPSPAVLSGLKSFNLFPTDCTHICGSSVCGPQRRAAACLQCKPLAVLKACSQHGSRRVPESSRCILAIGRSQQSHDPNAYLPVFRTLKGWVGRKGLKLKSGLNKHDLWLPLFILSRLVQ